MLKSHRISTLVYDPESEKEVMHLAKESKLEFYQASNTNISPEVETASSSDIETKVESELSPDPC